MNKRPSIPLVLMLAVLLALSVVVVACGEEAATDTTVGSTDTSAEGTDATAGGPSGTVSLIMLQTNQPGMEAVIADFAKEYPDITIEPEFIGDLSAFDTQVPTRFAADNGSDLIQLIAGRAAPVSVQRFAEAGHLADLSSEPWVSKMYEPTKPLMMYDGEVVAKDFGFCPLAALMYDKDFFAEHNLKVPTTYAELLEVSKQISGLGVTPISWGAGEVFVNTNNLVVMAGNTVFAQNPDWLQERLDGQTTFADTPGWRRALEQVKEMVDAGCFSPGAAGTSMADMISQFATGQAAMMFTYGGMAGLVLQETPDMNIGMIPFLAEDPADTRVIAQASGGVAVWSKSQNQEAAKTFLEFWSRDEQAQKFADASAIISPAQAISGQLTGSYTELSDYFASGRVIADPTANWPNTSMNEKTGGSIQGLFTGQKTVDQVLADMDTFFEAK